MIDDIDRHRDEPMMCDLNRGGLEIDAMLEVRPMKDMLGKIGRHKERTSPFSGRAIFGGVNVGEVFGEG